MNKKLIFLIVVILAVASAGGIFYQNQMKSVKDLPVKVPAQKNISASVEVIKTNPDPLDYAIVRPDQVIEVTFSDPIENIGELKHEFSPQFDYNTKLSNDKKTVTFTPKTVYPLGLEISLFIRPETKFVGGKKLDKEWIYHFKTIQYRGV